MTNNLLVLQSDFGLVDGAVSAMIGVALQEEPSLGVHHLTHDITPYNTFEASYRLFQTVEYWPKGITFVSVVGLWEIVCGCSYWSANYLYQLSLSCRSSH